MAKVTTTSTVFVDLPVQFSFTCPKCGQNCNDNKKARISGSASVRGSNSSAANTFAQNDLVASAENQINNIMNNLENGRFLGMLDETGKKQSSHVICSHCGIRQVVDNGKRNTLYPTVYAGILIGLFIGVEFLVRIIISIISRNMEIQVTNSMLFIGIGLLLGIIAVIVALSINKAKSNRAYTDPALMEKRYHAVVNPHMDAMLMVGVGDIRNVSIPKQ